MISPGFGPGPGYGVNPAMGGPFMGTGCPCSGAAGMFPQQQMQMLAQMQQLLQMMQMMGGGGAFPGAGFPGSFSPLGAAGIPGGFPGGGGFPGAAPGGGGFPGTAGGPGPGNPASTGTVMRSGKPIGAQIAGNFDAMVAAAAQDGVQLRVNSGKRSYQEQVALFNKYGPGRAARPGRSNHESGNAIDFTNTPGAYNWLKRNAARFGFYNKIPHEPWHYSTSGR